VLGIDFNAGRLCKVMKHFRGFTFGKLSVIKIDAHFHAVIGGTCEGLHDWSIG